MGPVGEIGVKNIKIRFFEIHLTLHKKCVKYLLEGIKMAIDQKLLDSALTVGGLKTKKETVNLALKEFIQRRKQMDVTKLAGTIDFDENWNPRKMRGKK
jgi:Arc/MetJ family transcription regulator